MPLRIAAAEWPLLKILWDHPGQWLPAAEVIEPVARQRGIHHRTARTLLARLVKKKAVETRPAPAGAAYLYRAKIPRDQVVQAEARSFLSRVFDGNAAPALVHFLRHEKLSPEELADLRQLLNNVEKQKP
jgi:BlaI family penicillinase repressor